MRQLTLMLQIFLFGMVGAASGSIELELASTEYNWIGEGQPPSCGIVQARSNERKRRIREFLYYQESLPTEFDDFFVDSYLLNRYFLEDRIWEDTTIEVEHRWNVSTIVADKLFALRELTYWGLDSDGISWVAKPGYFPGEVNLKFMQDTSEIITRHRTYYVDYCNPRKKPVLRWYPDPNIDLTTTTENVEKFLETLEGELK